jgi:hypothetical protein
MRAIRRALAAGTVDPDLLTSAQRRQYEGYLRREGIVNLTNCSRIIGMTAEQDAFMLPSEHTFPGGRI